MGQRATRRHVRRLGQQHAGDEREHGAADRGQPTHPGGLETDEPPPVRATSAGELESSELLLLITAQTGGAQHDEQHECAERAAAGQQQPMRDGGRGRARGVQAGERRAERELWGIGEQTGLDLGEPALAARPAASSPGRRPPAPTPSCESDRRR